MTLRELKETLARFECLDDSIEVVVFDPPQVAQPLPVVEVKYRLLRGEGVLEMKV